MFTLGIECTALRDMSSSLAGPTFENESLAVVGAESDFCMCGVAAD